LLVAFLVPTAVLMHGFWKESDGQAKQMEQVQFFKDVALAGAALMLFALFAHVGNDLGLMLTGPLFDL
jgi:putative oxidoreductase